ncbi:MAG: tRNA 2-thiouridine(34) synthase MnmA [Marinifilaceae bacterium]
MQKKQIVVGISGGVDSFMATRLLQEQGYEVIGVHLELWGDTDNDKLSKIRQQLGIEIVTYEARELFKTEIVSQFVQGYLNGCTPNPCSICNNVIKWKLLALAANELGILQIATGHYVRIEERGGHWYIRKGVDPNKDQSYFLWGVPQALLQRSLTPLGGLHKQEVKQMAQERGFIEIAKQPESMGICFLRGENYRDFIRRYANTDNIGVPGVIRRRNGEIIGQHSGILNYTIGQKQGIPVATDGALYVAQINVECNEIIVDVKNALMERHITVGNVHIVSPADLNNDHLQVKVRGLGLNPEGYVKVDMSGEKLHIELSNPAWAVAPGQPIAIYDGEFVIGGGVVAK